MKLNRTIVAVILVAALALAGVSALAEATLTVRGIGNVKVDADRAGINLGVREVSKDVMTAQSKVNERIAAIIDALKAMGVDAGCISTSGLGIYPEYSYDSIDDGESISGYTAYNNIYLTVSDVNNVGAYIDAAFAAGANSLDYVEFSAADTEEASRQALKLAVESATDKARIIAEAAGMKLGGILEIRDGEDVGYDSNAAYARSEEAGAGAGTEVLAARQTVSAAVVIVFALEP